jgi:hypothetical protein
VTTTPQQRRAIWLDIEGQIYPLARPAVQPWDRFPFHSKAYEPHSSQVMAISFFGTLMAVDQRERDLVGDMVAGLLGLPQQGTWACELEWSDPNRLLREKSPTQVDAVLRSEEVLILIEGKFTERPGGCSQTKARSADEEAQCTGDYALQTNPANGKRSRCALSAKGIRYWKEVPRLLGVLADTDHSPCPFAKGEYQLMRNAVTAAAAGEASGRKAGFLLAYADGPDLHTAGMVAASSGEWARFARRVASTGALCIGAASYQDLARKAASLASDPQVWNNLATWLDDRVVAERKSRAWRNRR